MRLWLLLIGTLLAMPMASVSAQSRSDSRDYTAYNAYWNGTNWVSYASGYSNFLTTNTSTGDFTLYTGGTAAGAGLTRTLVPVMQVTAAGTVSAVAFVGDGSGLTGVVASTGDRIVSGTTSMIAYTGTGYISVTQAGTNTAYFHPSLGLISVGVSATGAVKGTTVSGTAVNGYYISGTSIAGTLSTAAQTNITSVGTLTGLTINGTLTMTGATNTITATNVYATSVSGTTGTFGSIGVGAIAATGNITGTPLVSTSAAGKVSATYIYGKYISGTFSGDGSGLTGIPAPSSMSWYSLTSVPTVLQNISTSTGSVTVTSINATTGTFTNVAGTLSTAAQTNITSVGTLTGLTINGTLTMTGATNTITATNIYGKNISGTTGTFGTLGITSLAASGALTASNFRAPDGDTASAPGFAWQTDTNTGIYHPVTDVLGVSINGTERLRVGSGGISVTGTISASSAISFNTGGTIFGDSNDSTYTGSLVLLAGSHVNNGAAIYMYTNSATSYAGKINMYATSDTTTSVLYTFSQRYTSGSATTLMNLYGDASATIYGQARADTFYVNATDTAALPGLSWNADTNTGIYRPAADVIGLSTGGTERARITSAGISTTGDIVAASFSGDGSALTNLPAPSSLSWYSLTSVPTVLQNISTSTGSVTVTSINATTGTFTNVAGTLSTAAQANITSVGTLTGLTINGTLTMTGATNTITATNIYGKNISGTTGSFASLGISALTASGIINASNFRAPDAGSLSAPSFAWQTSTNTGMYMPATDVIGLVNNGTERARITAYGISTTGTITATGVVAGSNLRAPDGDTASAPGFAWQTDTNTGIYHPVADVIGLSINGTERMRLTASGISTTGTVYGTTGTFTNVAGTLTTAVQNNIKDLGTLTDVVTTGNISMQNGGIIYGDDADATYSSSLSLYGGVSTTTGAYMTLYGIDASNSGRAMIVAVSDTLTSKLFYIYTRTAVGAGVSTERMSIKGNGETILNGQLAVSTTSAPSYALDVNGTTRTTSVVYSSDARLKDKVATITDPFAGLTKIRGVSFEFKKDPGRRRLGVIAQEVEKVYPEMITVDKEGYKAVDYPQLVAPLIEAVKVLKAENDDLKQKQAAMDARLRALESALQQRH